MRDFFCKIYGIIDIKNSNKIHLLPFFYIIIYLIINLSKINKMLIEFRFRNFTSFKNEVSFLMTSVKSFKELKDTNLIHTDREFDILKSAAIYGMNGSGKSNFIFAMLYMAGIIHNSVSNSLKKEEEKPKHDFQFKLSTTTENKPTLFEVSFILNNDIYRYGYEIFGHKIIKEWLYRKGDRENYLFTREENTFKINNTSFPEGKKFKDEVNENVLFISHLAQNNQPISKSILNWFKNVNILSGLNENSYEKFTTQLLESDKKFKDWLSFALKFLEITNISAGEKNGDIFTFHNKYDQNNLLIDSIPFNIKEEESDGTSKLIYLLGPIYDTLRNGRILFVDEFDNKLHPNLSKKLIILFNKYNRNKAQLIFTGHDVSLLDKDLFRRDQIWFVNKDQFGASEMYSLSDFNAKTVRKDSAYDKKYLKNQFGSADTIELDNKLMNLLYA